MLAKKINAKLKRAYYYFGFEEVAAYEKVRKNIDILLEKAADESVLNKVKEQKSENERSLKNKKKREDFDCIEAFAKDEPRKSWDSYTDDFPEDIFADDVESDDAVEPVEDNGDEGEVEPVAEAAEDEGEIEPETEEEESEGEIEPDEDEGEVEPVIVTDINVIVVDRESEPIESAVISLTSGTRFEGSTGNDGKCIIKEVALGDYSVLVKADGFNDFHGKFTVSDDDEVFKVILTKEIITTNKTKIYINGELLGYCENPVEFNQ